MLCYVGRLLLRYVACGVLTESYKGKTVTHPFSNYTVVMFIQGYVTVFLDLCDLVSKERHKATTPNCLPQGKGDYDGNICKLALCFVCCLDGIKFI